MQYPLISEYVDAIRSAEDNFDKLNNLRPVLDGSSNPVMSSGNFAVVFKMEDIDTGKFYAVKCFTKEQAGREEAYRQITDELEFVQSTYLAKVSYYDRELFVDTNSSDESEFPVLLMDWVDGTTLDRYVRQNLNDRYALEVLAYNFSRFAIWLLPQPFAHGDLKPDNILVRPDGSLTLVDYDGMFVPAMQGQKSRELGSPDFRHPLRTADDFSEHIDDFPAVSILLSLRLIAADPSLLDKYGAADRLLFSESDYRDLSSCRLLKAVFPSQDAEVNTLVGLFAIAYRYKTLANVSFRLLAVVKPQKSEEELSTEVTDEDLWDAIEDEFGVKYSQDGKRLLKGVHVQKYKIKEGTRVICDWAFSWRSSLQEISIPEGVTSIGNSAFSNCRSLQKITIPEGVTSIGNSAFSGCRSLQKITIPSSVKRIDWNPFMGCKYKLICKSPHFKVVGNSLYDADMTVLISFLSNAKVFAIPDGVTNIGNWAFFNCNSLQAISIPNGVTSIGDGAFSYCFLLREVSIPEGVTSIGNSTFSGCRSLQKITIPSSVKRIGANPFVDCKCKVICNSPYFKIVDDVLYDANMTTIISFLSNNKTLAIPEGVKNIGDSAFEDCSSLQEISIPNGVTSIGDDAFCNCSSLKKISISVIANYELVANIELLKADPYTWGGTCYYDGEIGVTSIGHRAFNGCKSLQEIFIPDSVTSIGDDAFNDCNSLQEIKIPKGSRTKFEKLLHKYKDKLAEV